MKAHLYQPAVLFALALMAVIIMMVLPVPAWLLDIGLAASFALAILVFTVTIFIERPLDFSAFPTVLLASLMLRLSLNVSSTKLIIGEGHTGPAAAGNVINGFASFIMSGNVILGLVVFCVLLIVNFVVITKGATRMAEVGARFALDAMPGKQMAIDSDMAAGAIGHEEARARRGIEQQETTFLGSLDGASKFVKGDAIAGLLITALNLIVGLATGVFGHGMPVATAFETYAILTVGDGLVSQIPAVILSIAAALLLSRGGQSGTADAAVFGQLGQAPQALATVAALMAVFGLVPGLPFLPFVLGALGLAFAAFWTSRKKRAQQAKPEQVDKAEVGSSLGDILELDDIRIQFSPDLVDMILDPGTGLDARIDNMRTFLAESFGFLLPDVRLSDDPALPPRTYVVEIMGVERARANLFPDHFLALPSADGDLDLLEGHRVSEPVYGADAVWVATAQREAIAVDGLTTVSPAEVLATHLLELVKQNFSRLLGLRSLKRLLEETTKLTDQARAASNKRLLDELMPDKLSYDFLLGVLRHLLDEHVSIRNLPSILEVAAGAAQNGATSEQACEIVRRTLGYQIVADLKRQDGTIPLLQLSPDWEEVFRAHQTERFDTAASVALPPELFGKLAEKVAHSLKDAANAAAIVASPGRRRFLRSVLFAHGITLPVLSFEEMGLEAKPTLIGVVPT